MQKGKRKAKKASDCIVKSGDVNLIAENK